MSCFVSPKTRDIQFDKNKQRKAGNLHISETINQKTIEFNSIILFLTLARLSKWAARITSPTRHFVKVSSPYCWALRLTTFLLWVKSANHCATMLPNPVLKCLWLEKHSFLFIFSAKKKNKQKKQALPACAEAIHAVLVQARVRNVMLPSWSARRLIMISLCLSVLA